MLTFADMGGRGGQVKSDMLTWRLGMGDNWIGKSHLYADQQNMTTDDISGDDKGDV